MKRKIIALTLTALLLFAAGCKKPVTKTDYKDVMGTAPIFSEDKGFYDNAPVIIQTDASTRYLYYTSNETKNTEGDIIVSRKGTKSGTEWTYGERTIALKPSADGWDSKRVNNPSVIAGTFAYNSTNYAYLMAYSGNKKNANEDNQIGFAVAASPEGPWTKVGTQPFVKYNPDEVGGSAFGAGEPSLVSYDKASKVRLFYTFGEPRMTMTRCMELDLANVAAPVDAGYISLSVVGLQDTGSTALLANTGFAWDDTNDMFYVVRDRFPKPTNAKPEVATSLEVSKASESILYGVNHGTGNPDKWTHVVKIDEEATATETLTGWERIYSGSIVTDKYGWTLSTTALEVIFSGGTVEASETDTTYKFASCIIPYTVAL